MTIPISRRSFVIYFTIFFFIFYNTPLYSQSDINVQQKLPSNDAWWQMFGDPLLDSLIQKAVDNNYNLLNAMKNIEMAKAQLRIRQSGFYPTLDLTAAYSPEKNSLGIEHINERNYTGEASINVSWEVDVFGSIRKSARSQKEFWLASQEDYRAVMVSLVAQLSTTYIQLRTNQKQLDVANQNLASQKEIWTLTESKFNAGLTSKLNVAQAKSLYLQTKAMIPAMEAAIYQQVNTINVLTGEYSEPLRRILLQPASLPNTEGLTARLQIPADQIRQRPDIRAAERTMDGLTAAVGATRADWWPKFYINGSFGYGADKFKHFTRDENMDWQITPSVKWTIFSGRQLVQTTKNAQLQLDEGINNYNYTLLTALQEVDDALMSYNKSLLQLQADREAMVQIKQTLDLAVELYQKGLADYQSVLDSQRNLFGFENTLVSAESSAILYLIQLYKALGGGWQTVTNN